MKAKKLLKIAENQIKTSHNLLFFQVLDPAVLVAPIVIVNWIIKNPNPHQTTTPQVIPQIITLI